jgi:hypothetical protein
MDNPSVRRNKTGAAARNNHGKRLFEMLLPLQPFTGLLSAVTVRFQAHHDRLDNDRAFPLGVWREVWRGNSSPLKRPVLSRPTGALGLMYSPGSLYTILYQFVEQKLGQVLASAVCRRYLEWATLDRADFKHTKEAFEEGDVMSRPGLYAGYLAVKCAVFAAVHLVSHPFSILRTVVLMRGNVPLLEDGVWANLHYASPWAKTGLYMSSLGAHVVAGTAEVCLTDVALRTLRHAYRGFLTRQQAASGATRRRGEPLPGTHVDRLRAKLNYATAVSALQVVASFAVHTLLFPLLTVRMRLEAQGGVDDEPVTALRHLGLVECVRSIWANEGGAGFYRGFGAHVLTFAGNALWIGIIYGLTEAYINLDVDEEDD